MGGRLHSTEEDSSGPLRDAIEDVYRVFAGYRLKPHTEGCPHCVSDRDHALIHSRPLRLLEPDDLNRFTFKAMTTWGDENDFRHFLPRILELLVSGDPDWSVDTEIVLGKLARAGWWQWPEREQAALRTLLRLRWSDGLAHDLRSRQSHFDADSWLCGVACTGEQVRPYIEAWQQLGATRTLGHVAAFLIANPDLLTRGSLDNAFWSKRDPQTAVCATEMRTWLTACLDDPEFQAQLAQHYQT
jgi:hypothetical protein